MSRRTSLSHRYVEFIPKELEDGVLYISNRFRTASHKCCCGCGHKVVTPLNSAKWRLVDHGTTVSLAPSVGLGTLPCRSHYWVRRSQIDWYPNMTGAQTAKAQQADRYASQVYTGERLPPLAHVTPRPISPPASNMRWWDTLWTWLKSLWQ